MPLFKRRTEKVGGLLPDLYLHGLAQGRLRSGVAWTAGRRGAAVGAVDRPAEGELAAEYDLWKTGSVAELDVVYLRVDGRRAGEGQGSDPSRRVCPVAWPSWLPPRP